MCFCVQRASAVRAVIHQQLHPSRDSAGQERRYVRGTSDDTDATYEREARSPWQRRRTGARRPSDVVLDSVLHRPVPGAADVRLHHDRERARVSRARDPWRRRHADATARDVHQARQHTPDRARVPRRLHPRRGSVRWRDGHVHVPVGQRQQERVIPRVTEAGIPPGRRRPRPPGGATRHRQRRDGPEAEARVEQHGGADERGRRARRAVHAGACGRRRQRHPLAGRHRPLPVSPTGGLRTLAAAHVRRRPVPPPAVCHRAGVPRHRAHQRRAHVRQRHVLSRPGDEHLADVLRDQRARDAAHQLHRLRSPTDDGSRHAGSQQVRRARPDVGHARPVPRGAHRGAQRTVGAVARARQAAQETRGRLASQGTTQRRRSAAVETRSVGLERKHRQQQRRLRATRAPQR